MKIIYVIFAINPVTLLTMTKETILAAVQALPEQISLNELIERLILIEKIEKGREQSRLGQTISQEEVKQLVKTWFK